MRIPDSRPALGDWLPPWVVDRGSGWMHVVVGYYDQVARHYLCHQSIIGLCTFSFDDWPHCSKNATVLDGYKHKYLIQWWIVASARGFLIRDRPLETGYLLGSWIELDTDCGWLPHSNMVQNCSLCHSDSHTPSRPWIRHSTTTTNKLLGPSPSMTGLIAW